MAARVHLNLQDFWKFLLISNGLGDLFVLRRWGGLGPVKLAEVPGRGTIGTERVCARHLVRGT